MYHKPKGTKPEGTMEGKEEQLSDSIRSVTSNVDLLEPLQNLSKKAVNKIIQKRLKQRENEGFQDLMEELRTLNLISVLYASTGETDAAMKYNSEALNKNDKNVNALACKAWYHLQAHTYYKSEICCDTLDEEKKRNPVALLVSKAEVAFAYSKLGMDMYPQAEKLFKEVLEECKKTLVPVCHVCNWKFSLAQTIRRQLDKHNTLDLTAFNDRKRRLRRVFELFIEIDGVSDESVKPIRAKTLVELGLLIKKLSRAREQINELTQDVRANNPEPCFEKALELQPDNVFVLERSGTFFRYIGDVDRSLLCLEKALQINETSYTHHHIALALVSQLNKQLKQNNSKLSINLEKEERFKPGLTYIEHDSMDKWEKPYPYEKIEKILFHLGKSYELNNNLIALLHKGVLLRITGKYEEARDLFKSMFNDRTCSLMYLANAYEKAAICNLLIRNQTDEMSKRNELEHDAKMYFRKTIEISCKLIARDLRLGSLYVAFPTLKAMVLGQSDKSCNVRNLRELGNLSRKLMNYSEALGLFKKALELESGEEEKKEVLMEVVKLCLQAKDYDNAIVHLKMIGCLPHASDKIDRQVYITTHIKAALLSWSKGEKEIARQRIEDVMNYVGVKDTSGKDECSNGITSKSGYHLYVLSSEASEDKARKLSDVLQDIGLCVTLNSEDIMPGRMETMAMLKIVERSKHVALFLGEGETEIEIQRLQFLVDNNLGNVTVISESEGSIENEIFKRFSRLGYACFIENQLTWVEKFLFMIAGTEPVDLCIC